MGGLEGHLHPVPVEFLLVNVDFSGPVSIEPHASERPIFLFRVQKARCCRGVGHEEEGYDAEGDGDCTFDYKRISIRSLVTTVNNLLKKIHGQRL